MKVFTCEKCGSGDFLEKNGYRICSYCRSKYSLSGGTDGNSIINLDGDIQNLLKMPK